VLEVQELPHVTVPYAFSVSLSELLLRRFLIRSLLNEDFDLSVLIFVELEHGLCWRFRYSRISVCGGCD